METKVGSQNRKITTHKASVITETKKLNIHKFTTHRINNKLFIKIVKKSWSINQKKKKSRIMYNI